MVESKKPYIYKPQAIAQHTGLTPLEQDYLCLIAQLSRRRGRGCTASNRYFAGYFHVSLSSAKDILANLKKKGFIKSYETKHGGKTVERLLEVVDEQCKSIFGLP